MGTPAASVVVATFGVFEPSLLTAVYQQAISIASRDDVLRARAEGAAESLAAIVFETDAAAVADPLLEALAAVDGMGRPLFSALRELPVPESAAGRLWRAAELVREHRGDGHLAACVAAGFDALTMNVLTELWLGYAAGEYSSTRGFGADRIAATVATLEQAGWADDDGLTPKGVKVRLRVEAATDESQAGLVRQLGDRLPGIVETSRRMSAQVLAAKAFPPDPRKRAAG